MDIERCLGMDDRSSTAWVQAGTHFKDWQDQQPGLRGVSAPEELPEWTWQASPAEKNGALKALGLIATTAPRDPAAMSVLLWLLVPGAIRLACSLRDLEVEINERVAGQLWICASAHDYSRDWPVAASILAETRRAILAELGVGRAGERADRAWARSTCLSPDDRTWQHLGPQASTEPVQELIELLDAAEAEGVVSATDRQLLVDVAVEADRLAARGRISTIAASGRSRRAGLTTPAAAERVAEQWGLSTVAVRRRTARVLDRLSEFAREVA